MCDQERPKTAEGLTIYRIPAVNLPGLTHKIGKLSRKSKKLLDQNLGLTVIAEIREPAIVMRGTHEIPLLDADGNRIMNVYYDVTVNVPQVKIPGWTFLATIDHTPAAGNIIRVVPGVVFAVPNKYREVGPICEHCNKIRGRRDTYLLRSDNGEIKQIGRQCLRDFLGHDVEAMVGMAEIYASAIPGENDGDEDWSGGMRDRRYIFVATYMAHVSRLMRAGGWISRKDAKYRDDVQSTASAAHYNMFPPPQAPRSRILQLTDEDYRSADAALEWAKNLTPRGDFETNMHLLSQETMIEYRSIGILAYILPAYLKHIQQEFQRLERRKALKLDESKHVGKLGERLRDLAAVLYGYYPVQGWGGSAAYIYKFQTPEGDILVWKSSNGIENLGAMAARNRTRVKLTGTVKNNGHREYQGVKETNLRNCLVTIVEDVETAAA